MIVTIPKEFESLEWFRLPLTLMSSTTYPKKKGNTIGVFQAVIEAVSFQLFPEGLPDDRFLVVFHFTGRKIGFTSQANAPIPVEILFFNTTKEPVAQWRDKLIRYFDQEKHQKSLRLISCKDIEDRNFQMLLSQWDTKDFLDRDEICLEFLSPLPFKAEQGKSRVHLSEPAFMRSFETRFRKLFGMPFDFPGATNDFSILPYYWHYREIRHASFSQPGHTQYIKGCLGKLYIKGNISHLLPGLILGSEIHWGSKRSNSQGYYKLLPHSPPHLDKTFPHQNGLTQALNHALNYYDFALEHLHHEADFDEVVFLAGLYREIEENQYTPSAHTAFLLHIEEEQPRMVEQLSFKDLVVSLYLLKTLGKHLESKPVTAEEFFSTIDLQRVKKHLKSILPQADTRVKALLFGFLDTGYLLDGVFHQRVKGLAYGNPLSPLLANLCCRSPADYQEAEPLKKPFYVTESFCMLSLNGESLSLKRGRSVIACVPLRRVSEIMVMEKTQFSSQLIKSCLENRIPFTITLNNGKYITTIKPDSMNHFEMSSTHAKRYARLSNAEVLGIAKSFAAGKISNYIHLFKQKYKKGANEMLDQLYEAVSRIHEAPTIETVRGVEGWAGKLVFIGMNKLIDFPFFQFEKRSRKNPDRINSLLNFGFYLLFSRINAYIRAAGLNPYLGFLHSPADNYESLVCDVQELFRARITRLIIRMINLKIIKDDDFTGSRKGNGFYLKRTAIKKYLQQFEAEMNKKTKEPSLSLKEEIYLQVDIIKQWVLKNRSLTLVVEVNHKE